MGGLNPQLPSGTIVIPSNFTPTSINDFMIYGTQKYTGKNDLVARINKILSSQREEDVRIINSNFLSDNPEKRKQKARLFTDKDIALAHVLEIDQLWNPKDPENKITVRK
ncbi:MAG: hypothetical protein GY915_02450 [bacterium]|nr:hypothetical protein [bacterium]